MSECNSVECNSIESAECSSIEETYNKKNKEEILNRAKIYDENDKKRLRDQTRGKYRNLSEEEKK